MEKKSVGKRCLDLWGEENQIFQMIEEGSELVTMLCHRRRGRYNADHVFEEIADCFAMLDQMDLIFSKTWVSSAVPNPANKVHTISLALLFILGELQAALVQYIQIGREGEKIKGLLYSFRQHLNHLASVTDDDAIVRWKGIKLKRILERIELNK